MERAKAIVFPFLVASAEWRVATWAERSRGQGENSGLTNIKSLAHIPMAFTEGIPLSSGEGPGVRPIALTFSLLTFYMITKKIVTPPN